MSSSRQIAFDILVEVESGGYASDLLTVHCAALDRRDAALASTIALGVLRYRAQLDCLIAQLSGRGTGKLDREVLTALRMGVYQLRYLDRIPAHAAVDASVDLVKRARKRSAAGFVNAVLRKVHRKPIEWPDRATALSCPEWILARWESAFGREAAESIARAALATPERFIRVPANGIAPEAAEATEIPGCYRLASGEAAPFRIQDIGSQSIVPLLDLQPGHRFLDLCAAPGNKTAQALEQPVRAVASDVSYKRLHPLSALGIPLVLLDATQPLPFAPVFDRILIDAPCTGTGTLAHNPEIKWRLRPEDIARQAERQRLVLRNALAVLAPRGLLVYSTCSLEPEENEAVVAEVSPARQLRRQPGRDPGDGFFAAIVTPGASC
jgi:16S rRNA (cytosine967-C5)-methyltransferase